MTDKGTKRVPEEKCPEQSVLCGRDDGHDRRFCHCTLQSGLNSKDTSSDMVECTTCAGKGETPKPKEEKSIIHFLVHDDDFRPVRCSNKDCEDAHVVSSCSNLRDELMKGEYDKGKVAGWKEARDVVERELSKLENGNEANPLQAIDDIDRKDV